LELKSQIEAGLMPEPELIFVALGSGGTMAGLEVGLRIAELKTKVIGVRVVDRVVANAHRIASLVNRTIQLLQRCGCSVPVTPIQARSVTFFHSSFGSAYGAETAEGRRMLEQMQELEGITLDTTYTAKALAGCVEYLRRQRLQHSVHLFWNTCSRSCLSGSMSTKETTLSTIRP